MTPPGGLGDYGCTNPIFSITLRQRLGMELRLPRLNSAGLALPGATLNRIPAPGLGGPLAPPVFRRRAAAQIAPGRHD